MHNNCQIIGLSKCVMSQCQIVSNHEAISQHTNAHTHYYYVFLDLIILRIFSFLLRSIHLYLAYIFISAANYSLTFCIYFIFYYQISLYLDGYFLSCCQQFLYYLRIFSFLLRTIHLLLRIFSFLL